MIKTQGGTLSQGVCLTCRWHSKTDIFWFQRPRSQGLSRPVTLCSLQCPEKNFKRTGETWTQARTNACDVGTWTDGSQWQGEAGTAEGRGKCGSNLLKMAGTSSIKGTAGWFGLKGKERSSGKEDTVGSGGGASGIRGKVCWWLRSYQKPVTFIPRPRSLLETYQDTNSSTPRGFSSQKPRNPWLPHTALEKASNTIFVEWNDVFVCTRFHFRVLI